MRLFINGMLAFAVAGFVIGLVPITAQELHKLRQMKTDLAIAQAAQHVKLRGSSFEEGPVA